MSAFKNIPIDFFKKKLKNQPPIAQPGFREVFVSVSMRVPC